MADQRILIHPLVIASACDHYTRVVRGGTLFPRDSTIIGLLLGTRDPVSGAVHVMDAIDLSTSRSASGEEVFSAQEVERRVQLFTAVYTNYVLLGWFSFGEYLSPQHNALHESLSSLSFSHTHPLLMLLFSTKIAKEDIERLPVRAFASEPVHGRSSLAEKPWRTASLFVEKIAVDRITRSMPHKGATALEVMNESLSTSTQILSNKIDKIVAALKAMKSGATPVNHDLLRCAATVCKSLEAIEANDELLEELDDKIDASVLVSFLNAASKNYKEMRALNDAATIVLERAPSSSYGEHFK